MFVREGNMEIQHTLLGWHRNAFSKGVGERRQPMSNSNLQTHINTCVSNYMGAVQEKVVNEWNTKTSINRANCLWSKKSLNGWKESEIERIQR